VSEIFDVGASFMQRCVIAIVHAPTRPFGSALSDQPAVTQFRGELPRVGYAPLTVRRLE
jgi:hypothetical protein